MGKRTGKREENFFFGTVWNFYHVYALVLPDFEPYRFNFILYVLFKILYYVDVLPTQNWISFYLCFLSLWVSKSGQSKPNKYYLVINT